MERFERQGKQHIVTISKKKIDLLGSCLYQMGHIKDDNKLKNRDFLLLWFNISRFNRIKE